jgi:uncharacterized protein YjbI with pentapeptide repeats
MMPSLPGPSSLLRTPLASPHHPPVTPYTGARDEAIRTAFAVFDTPAQEGTQSIAHSSARFSEEVRDRGVQVRAIDDYLKCIFGLPHEEGMIAPRVSAHIHGLDSMERSAPHALSVARLTALAAFYIAACQARAFNADGEFDTGGLVDFVAARLAMPKDVLEQALTGSALGEYVFMSMRQSQSAPQLSIYDAHGQDLLAPAPALRFECALNGAIGNGYLRNVTLSTQTLRATDLSSTDLSGAYIDNCVFECVPFNNTNLSGAVFNGVDAKQCNFSSANLADAVFRDSRLRHTEFFNCQMVSTRFCATPFQGARFERCNLHGMTFDNGSSFEAGTRLSIDKSEFHACDMTAAQLRNMQWKDGRFIDCRLWDAAIGDSELVRITWQHQWDESEKPPLSGAAFDAIQFRNCVLKQLDASMSRWARCSFSKGTLAGVSWRDGTLRSMRFESVDMPHARFNNAQCEGLRFETMCDLDSASFAHAKLTKVRFDGVYGRTLLRLNAIDFSAAELEDVRFTRCNMIGAQFSFAQMRSVIFARSTLNHANFNRSRGGDLLNILLENRMKLYTADGMITEGADIGSLSDSISRHNLLNHIDTRESLLGNILSGMSGAMTAHLVLHLADALLAEAQDPIDSDAWMITALSQAYTVVPFDADARARIDVHLFRMLQRHLPALNDLGLRDMPEHRWGLDALDHLRRLLRSHAANGSAP